MTMDQDTFAARCMADGELRLACRHWAGGLRLEVGESVLGFTVADGTLSEEIPNSGGDVITLAGAAELWAPLFEATPPPFAQVSVLAGLGPNGLQRIDTDHQRWWQYLPAVERAAELLRAPGLVRGQPRPARPHGTVDSPVGRYVHLDLQSGDGSDTHDYRIYVEEAGTGIPVLLQHTAGAHSVQWRHLFENPEITDRFRLIAYDLPFHGKSVPPTGPRWWEEEYRLRGAFLRQIPTKLASVLELDRPVFMGCSVGGLLALDLALHHPDTFRAVISLEGALHVGGGWESLDGFWHPQVSNITKARMMEGLCAPGSPEAYVKEVSQVYSAGWPPVFIGDLWYYMMDFDIRDRAHEIDTQQVAVHILSGEYDYSGRPDMGQAAHAGIAGSTWSLMPGLGHFPMTEHPDAFLEHLLPVLDRIESGGVGSST